jgi:hypothetical protein
MGSHDIDKSYELDFLSVYKYWPDDGLFRPNLVANIFNQ